MSVFYIRSGGLFAVTLPHPDGADRFEELLKALPDAPPPIPEIAIPAGIPLGDLTEDNAIRADLKAQRDAIQDEIDALDIHNNPEPGLAAKQAKLIARREAFNAILRATMIDTNPTTGG
jgi:hypothetical protein